jgi:ribosomal protein S18 acetylase RimI-like enzyme
MTQDQISIPNIPSIAGLSFRRFQGESDYPHILAVISASEQADQIDRIDTLEEIANRYSQLSNCDPYHDMIFAEINGEVIGYLRGFWQEESETVRVYNSVGFIIPAWRRKGIGNAMLHWMEDRLREVAAAHPAGLARFFQVEAKHFQEGKVILLERAGYQPVRYFQEMVRLDLENISETPLPAGLEVRPVLPEHYRQIWASADETFQDEWSYTRPTEEDYQSWLADPHFQPHLWQIAWDTATDQVVGHVLTYIDQAQNEKLNQKRGYTEGIGVRHDWRRRGLARALIALSLQTLKAQGMSESAMIVDSENLSGATRLYESCGFQVVRCNAIYRKPF